MAATAVNRALVLLAEGKVKEAALLLAKLKTNDPAIGKTSSYKEAERSLIETSRRAGITAGMTDADIATRVKKAYKELNDIGDAPDPPKSTSSKSSKSTPKSTNAEDLTTTTTGGTGSGYPEGYDPRAPLQSRAPAAGPLTKEEARKVSVGGGDARTKKAPRLGSVLPAAEPSGNTKGAKKGAKATGATSATSPTIPTPSGPTTTAPSSPSSPLSPGAATALDDMATQAAATGRLPYSTPTAKPLSFREAIGRTGVPSSPLTARESLYASGVNSFRLEEIDRRLAAQAEVAVARTAEKEAKKAAKRYRKEVSGLQTEGAEKLAAEQAAQAAEQRAAEYAQQVRAANLAAGEARTADFLGRSSQQTLARQAEQTGFQSRFQAAMAGDGATAYRPPSSPAAAALAEDLAAATGRGGLMARMGGVAGVSPAYISNIPGLNRLPVAANMVDEAGALLGPKARWAASGKLGGLIGRGGTGLMASGLANEMIVNPLQERNIISDRVGGALKGGTTGAAIGAAIGSPAFGVGAGVGAAVGGGLGALLGALSGGGGGSKGDFDEASIMALPGLSDYDKQALITEYQFMLSSGTPKRQAQDTMRAKATQTFTQSQASNAAYARALPNIMALQGLTAAFARPYYDDYKAANNAQYSMAQQMATALPENQRGAALAYADTRRASNDQTAAAFGQANLLAPAFFLQDALRQNAYGSGAPPLAGLGLSGGLGGAGGGGAGSLEELLAASK